jgi:hypothetical protein
VEADADPEELKHGDRGKHSSQIKAAPLTVDPHRSGFGKIPCTTWWRAPPPCPIYEGVLGVDLEGRTRGNITNKAAGGDQTWSGDGVLPTSPTQAKHLGFGNPPPTTAPSHFESIARFVGSSQNPTPKSYVDAVRSISEQVMVYAGADRGASRRKGFGFGHDG